MPMDRLRPILSASLLLATAVVAGVGVGTQRAAALSPHAPIVIGSDWEFTSANGVTSGTGTPSDPYVIFGWEIDATGDAAIRISSTEVHFILRDMVLHVPDWESTGVLFYTVKNARVENVSVDSSSGGSFGVSMHSSSSVEITDSEFLGLGILIEYATGVSLVNNRFSGTSGRVYATSSHGVSVLNNSFDGSYLAVEMRYVQGTGGGVVRGNRVNGSHIGIGIYDGSEVEVFENVITSSSEAGIYVMSGSGEFSWNVFSENTIGINAWGGGGSIHHNSFIDNNRDGVSAYGGFPWDRGYPDGGNWWYDYTGVDHCTGPEQDVCGNPDGIGDTPYSPDYLQGIIMDRYPLMPPYQRPFADFSVSDVTWCLVACATYVEGNTLEFDASPSYDPDGEIASYRWDFGDGTSASGRVVTHRYSAAGSYNVVLVVTDDEGRNRTVDEYVGIRPRVEPYPSAAFWACLSAVGSGIAAAVVVRLLRRRAPPEQKRG